jgi:lipopolysaccharide/colanic/teichoic acid biosynthesis glycosyltransferase
MVRMDLRYVRNWSLTLDLKILIQTALIVLSKRGGG